jgi:hypothetical protein
MRYKSGFDMDEPAGANMEDAKGVIKVIIDRRPIRKDMN